MNAADKRGATPLYVAAQFGRVGCVRLLLDAGADRNSRDMYGFTPLYAGASYAQLEVVKMLLAGRASADQPESHGSSPLHIACQEGHSECAKVLLAAGARPNCADGEGFTPLYLACQNDKQECAATLIAGRASVDQVRPSTGGTALHISCELGRVECVALLLAAHAQLELMLMSGETPIHSAASGGHPECVAMLLAAGAESAAIACSGPAVVSSMTTWSPIGGFVTPLEAIEASAIAWAVAVEEAETEEEKEEAVGKAEGYRLCGALLRRSQAEEHGITQGLSIKEIVANNAKKKWREKTVAAAAKITLTAGQRLRLLSGLEGLKTKASRPTRCDKLMAFFWASLLNLRRFGYSLLTALLLLPYGIIAALTTCTQSAFISVGEGIEEFAKYNLRSCFGGVPIAEHLSGLWQAIYAFFAMIFGRCMPGRGAYDDEVSLLPEGRLPPPPPPLHNKYSSTLPASPQYSRTRARRQGAILLPAQQ